MPMGINCPRATLKATPAANVQDIAREAAKEARPALKGKRYMTRTASTKARVMALICMAEAFPKGN